MGFLRKLLAELPPPWVAHILELPFFSPFSASSFLQQGSRTLSDKNCYSVAHSCALGTWTSWKRSQEAFGKHFLHLQPCRVIDGSTPCLPFRGFWFLLLTVAPEKGPCRWGAVSGDAPHLAAPTLLSYGGKGWLYLYIQTERQAAEHTASKCWVWLLA